MSDCNRSSAGFPGTRGLCIDGQSGRSRKTEGNIVERSPDTFITRRFCYEIIYHAGIRLASASPAFRKIRQLQYDENFDLYDGHIISKDGRYMLLFVSPAFPADNTGRNEQLLNGMDQIISRLQGNGFNMIQANYFGSVAVAAGNARQLRKDSILTLSITTLFLILFISWYFKKKRAPFLILLPVILGALFSLVHYLLDQGNHFGDCTGSRIHCTGYCD